MTKKVVSERVKPAPYVSIKYGSTGIHVRFTKYANRAILCKLSLTRKVKDNFWSWWAYTDESESKARCHPGGPDPKNPKVIIPPDTFDEKVGMDIAYLRASKEYKRRLKVMQNNVDESEKEVAKGKEAIAELTEAIEIFEREYAKLKDNNLLVCEER